MVRVTGSKWLFLAAAALLVLAACGQGKTLPAFSPSAGSGIPVAEPFRAFYQANGGELIFGYPLTPLYFSAPDGRQVQYFQRMRLELATDAFPTPQVFISPLGQLLYAGTAGEHPALQGLFQAFYQAHNGRFVFGPPISPQIIEGERWVQYFQNARLEWRPEEPPSARVRVSDLGQVHFNRSGAIYQYQLQVAGGFVPEAAASLSRVNVSANLESPVLFAGDRQTIWVSVTTPEGNPAPDLPVTLSLTFHDGEKQTLPLGTTDERGQVRQALALPQLVPGQQVLVGVQVQLRSGRVVGGQGLAFRVWW